MSKENEKIYGETLNLPKTDFPMRGNLPENEPKMLAFWEEIDIYNKVQEKNKGKKQFILHDGPPYANGHLHLGHTVNKVLKDMIVKFKSQTGFDTPFVPGWDTHGLPIELKAIETVGLDMHSKDQVGFRKACAEYAMKYVGIQRDEFKRLGARGDWANPYVTLNPEFEAEEIGVFGEMVKKGYIYKGTKPVHWCPSCETALAEAEIEYGDVTSPSIYVKFPLKDGKGKIDEKDTYFVIWTTTPWTLPANMAVCLNETFDYVKVRVGSEYYVLAKGLLETVATEAEFSEAPEIVETYKGKDLEGLLCAHPFANRDSLVILGTHVTLDAGTGCVHTAPGHGNEDYVVAQKYKLAVLSPLDDKGILTDEAGLFAGLDTKEANKKIPDWLKENGYLLKLKTIDHAYPLCWRCKTPTLFRATSQWFASIDGFRKEAMDQIENHIEFIPSWGKERIGNMIRDRGDWCISRQRIWGVPIPVFYCQDCHEIIMDDETIGNVQEIFRKHGSDAWYAMNEEALLPSGYTCKKCGGNHFKKETDIMDVWFDSGSSHMGVLKVRDELSWPADLYLEGSDQHRGWFNSSLCTGVGTKGVSPYKAVLTHGFVVDEQGRKMSKSLGNGVDPLEVINKQGADILRLWVSSTDYRSDISISNNILKQVGEAYRKIRNTFRYFLGSIYDFNPEVNRVSYENLEELDKWALMKLAKLVDKVHESYTRYEFHNVYREVFNFCNTEMSAFYLNIAKDRLYANEDDGLNRRSCQTVIYEICLALNQILSPILAFTTEEIFRFIPLKDKPESVQLMEWPSFDKQVYDEALEAKYAKLIHLRNEVAKPLEVARSEKLIGNSLDAEITLFLSDEWQAFITKAKVDLSELFLVSRVNLLSYEAKGNAVVSDDLNGVAISVVQVGGKKCPRCWKYSDEIGTDSEYKDVCPRCARVLKTK